MHGPHGNNNVIPWFVLCQAANPNLPWIIQTIRNNVPTAPRVRQFRRAGASGGNFKTMVISARDSSRQNLSWLGSCTKWWRYAGRMHLSTRARYARGYRYHTELVSGAANHPAFNSTAGHPHREAGRLW